ncbi:porin [Paraburkholderia ferrariae]|uniref:porin n=1 Tax=Paraburkholderia ferrariae TaxID=386056 RepID=UPI0005AB5E9F|nr:porin [Paraburkholderia ferrariae]
MKKVRVVACGLTFLAISGTACAQSGVQLYGVIDEFVGTQTPVGTKHAYGLFSNGMQTSYFGITGNEDLGGGYATVFRLEAYLTPSSGKVGRFAGDPSFWGRNAYVGLETPAGLVTTGRNTVPYFLDALRVNPFGNAFGFSPAMIQMYKGLPGQEIAGDTEWNNSVMYTSPGIGGFELSAIYGFGNAAGRPGQNQWGGSAAYGRGPLYAVAAYQQLKYNVTPGDLTTSIPGFEQQSALLAGATWDFRVVKVYGFYQHVDDSITTGDLSTNSGQLGVSIPFGDAGKLTASYMYMKGIGRGDPIRRTWAVGYDYRLSVRTDVYLAYTNDHATSAGTAGVGIRTAF